MRRFENVGRFLSEGSVSRKTLARVCRALFFCMLVPLILISFYNYPADDDFGFTLGAATAWVQTGSLIEVAKAIGAKTAEIYETWQGNFVSTALFGLTPMVFDIRLYFLDNLCVLALLCLSAGYLVRGATTLLRASRDTFWIVYTAVMVLVLQFMPSIAYSVYWHNGGMYTVAACTLFLLLGLLLRCGEPQSRARALWRGACAALCGFLLGGSFYGPMLGALVLLTLLCVGAWVRRSPRRWFCLVALLFFAASMAISVLAPGNQLRQERTGDVVSPLAAVLTAVLDSFDIAGEWLSPQLLGMLLLICPALWGPLKDSPFSFRRPLWALLALYGLFSASLVPGIYTGFGYTTERYYNVVYFYFLLWAIGGAIYVEGALLRRLERHAERDPEAALLKAGEGLGQRYLAVCLAASLALTTLGGFAYTIMNTSSVSAAKSLLNGEAARFLDDMRERQEYIRVTDSDVTQVEPLDSQPHVFKTDRLPYQGIYGRVRYMKWYFELFYERDAELRP